MHSFERDVDILQARAAALLRQNMELQQRQSSLERRAAFQKGLMAANRDHMQASCLHGIMEILMSIFFCSAGVLLATSAVSYNKNKAF